MVYWHDGESMMIWYPTIINQLSFFQSPQTLNVFFYIIVLEVLFFYIWMISWFLKSVNTSIPLFFFFDPETLRSVFLCFFSFRLSFENGSGEVLTVDLQILGQQVVVEPFPNDGLDGTKNEELVI